MKSLIKCKRGEGYVDVAVTVMIVAFVLLFAVNMVSLVALNQNMKIAADKLAEYASLQGTTAIDGYADELKEKIGVEFEYSFEDSEVMDETGKVQLGDKIVCKVSYSISIIGFGESIHPVEINAGASGISRVYWK